MNHTYCTISYHIGYPIIISSLADYTTNFPMTHKVVRDGLRCTMKSVYLTNLFVYVIGFFSWLGHVSTVQYGRISNPSESEGEIGKVIPLLDSVTQVWMGMGKVQYRTVCMVCLVM